MSSDELSYYRHRAADERAIAAQSVDPRVAEIHEKLASLYENLCEIEKERPTLSIVVSERLSA